MSGYMSGFSRRLEQLERESSKYGTDDKHAAVLRELNKVDPEGVIRWFETQSAAHRSPAALAEYVKALVKVDRLDQSALFKTLQRGNTRTEAVRAGFNFLFYSKLTWEISLEEFQAGSRYICTVCSKIFEVFLSSLHWVTDIILSIIGIFYHNLCFDSRCAKWTGGSLRYDCF